MSRLRSLVAVLFATTLVLSGCGASITNSGSVVKTSNKALNPPFKVKLDIEKATPSSQFNAQSSNGKYANIEVLDSSGKRISINPSKQPVLFEAYWCPHCQRTLVSLYKNRNKLKQMPILVSTGFAQGTSLSAAKKLTSEEEQALHIDYAHTYYLLNVEEAHNYVKGFPTFVFHRDSKVYTLVGEHELKIWEDAINQSGTL